MGGGRIGQVDHGLGSLSVWDIFHLKAQSRLDRSRIRRRSLQKNKKNNYDVFLIPRLISGCVRVGGSELVGECVAAVTCCGWTEGR